MTTTEILLALEFEEEATGPELHALALELKELDARELLTAEPQRALARLAAGHVPERRLYLVLPLDDRSPEDVAADLDTVETLLREYDGPLRRVRKFVTGKGTTRARDYPLPGPGESVETVAWRVMQMDLRKWALRATSREGARVDPDQVAKTLEEQANAVRRSRSADGK